MDEYLSPEDDERLRRKELSLGLEASSLLDSNGAFRRAFEEIRDQIWDDFRNCHPSDLDGLKTIRLRLGLLDDLQVELHQIQETGLMAEQQLAEMEQRRRAEKAVAEEGETEG